MYVGQIFRGARQKLLAKAEYALARIARWFVFKPKIQIWVNFGGSCNGR
jgi:hypothetical protein